MTDAKNTSPINFLSLLEVLGFIISFFKVSQHPIIGI